MNLYAVMFIAFFANVFLWGSMLFAERYEAKRGLIPAQKKLDKDGHGFLYLNDWSTASWGDYIGFSLIDIGAALALSKFWGGDMFFVVVVGGIIIASAFYFYSTCPSHRPDSSFPFSGKVSRSGGIHLLYYVVQASAGLWALGSLFVFDLPSEASYAIVFGVTIYFAAFVNDLRLHRFS